MKPRPPGSLKAAEAALVEAAGGLERAADLVGRSKSQVARQTDPAEPDAHLSADQIRLLECAARAPLVTAFLAAEAGALLLALDPAAPADTAEGMARTAAEAADLFGAYADALAGDGRIDAREAGRMLAQLDEVLAAAMRLRAALMRLRDGGERA